MGGKFAGGGLFDFAQGRSALHQKTGVDEGSPLASALVLAQAVPYSRLKMQNITETLGIGSRAPEFKLSVANREGTLALSSLLGQGPVIVEFLRGTW